MMNVLICLLFIPIVGFGISRITKKNDHVDIIWGIGQIVLAAAAWQNSSNLSLSGQVIFTMVIVWGLRLGSYIFIRSMGKPEDKRYLKMRSNWGSFEPIKAFFYIFSFQTVLMAIVSLPVLSTIMTSHQTPITPVSFLGLTLFLIGFAVETVADWEMLSFKKNPENKGKTLSSGLWSIVRHPNYLGEIMVWWGVFFVAFPSPYGLYTIVSPLLVSFLILKVSGIPMLEGSQTSRNYDSYRKIIPSINPIKKHHILSFLKLIFSITFLDYIWLGNIMKSFYQEQTIGLVETLNGQYVLKFWAVFGVYFFIPFGVLFFSSKATKAQSFFSGWIYGLTTYGIYEMTNIALVKGWPIEMALVDLAWGPVLCGVAALVARPLHLTKS